MRFVKLLAVLALAVPAMATASFVTGQHILSRSAACTGTCTFALPSAVTAGDTVTFCATNQTTTATLTVTMTGETIMVGAGWPQSPGTSVNAGQQYCGFIAHAVGGQTTFTVTPASGTQTVDFEAAEFHSTISGSWTENTATFHNGSCGSSCTSTESTGSITPTSAAGTVIFFAGHYGGGTAPTTCTFNNSFVSLDCDPAAYNRGYSAYLITTDTSAHTPSVTMGGSTATNWATSAIAIQEPSAGGASKIRHSVSGGGLE